MSDEQNKTESTESTQGTAAPSAATPSKAPAPAGGLPGLGAKPGGGGLPGLGAKPGGGLPGLGAKPGGGLPGLGAKPGGGGLPGLGAKPGGLPGAGIPAAGPVPSFVQKQQEKAREAQMARDPFGTPPPAAQPSVVPGMAPAAPAVASAPVEDVGPIDESVVTGTSKKIPIIVGVVSAVLFFMIGYGAGLAIYTRATLNATLRDAWIIEWEMKRLKERHGEVQAAVNAALAEARQRKFNKAHLAVLSEKVAGNPFNPRLFTERNYKNLNPMVVEMMAALFRDWEKLSAMVAEHRSKTRNDEKALTAAGSAFQKLLTTNYGVIFSRDEKTGNRFTANLVVLGGSAGGNKIEVQVKPGSPGAEREVYNPEGKDSKLTEEPEKYVVVLGEDSKKSLLQNATQSQFNQYTERLDKMSSLLKQMEEEQNNLFGPLEDNVSQEPVSFFARGIDPEAEFEEYKRKAAAGAGAAEE